MSFGGIFKGGITRSLSPFLLLHNGDGTSQVFKNGQFVETVPFIPNIWIEVVSSATDAVNVLEVSDIGTGFWVGMGAVGLEEELFYVELGFAGTFNIEIKSGDRMVIKPDVIPLAQTFSLFNFFKPSTALNDADTGRALVYHNGSVRALKSKLSVNDKATFLTGSHDPQTVSTFGLVGWFFLKNSDPGGLFLKTDVGFSTNWRRIGRDVEITSWDQLYDVDMEGLLDGMALLREDRPSPTVGGTGPVFVPAFIVEPLRKPFFTLPQNGDLSVPAMAVISLGGFSSVYNYDHIATEWNVSKNEDFTDLVVDEISNTDLTIKTIELEEDVQYWVKSRFIDDGGFESRWAFVSFRVQLEYVLQPTLLSPVDQATNIPISGTFVASNFVPIPDPNISHDETDWILSRDIYFTDIVFQSLNDAVNLNTIPYSGLDYSSTYFLKMRYRSYVPTYDDSSWSPTILFSTLPTT